jgi:hypothetical protein
MQNLQLFEYSPEYFWCPVHQYQYLAALIELTMMFFFQFLGFVIMEILGLLVCVIVSKSVQAL